MSKRYSYKEYFKIFCKNNLKLNDKIVVELLLKMIKKIKKLKKYKNFYFIVLKQNTEPDSAAPPPVIASQTAQPPGTDASVLCYTRPVEMAGIRTITRKTVSYTHLTLPTTPYV